MHSMQFGFMKGACTTSACASLMNNIFINKNKSLKTGCVFIDLKKAFDCINHKKLVITLKKYRIENNALKLMENYLQNRKQYVTVAGNNSKLNEIVCGVPQGSILGPVLFNLYVNEFLYLPLHGKCQFYADDCAVVYGAPDFITLKDQMKTDLEMLYSQFHEKKPFDESQ